MAKAGGAKAPRTKAPRSGVARKAKPAGRARRWPSSRSGGTRRGGGVEVLHTCKHKERHAVAGPRWKKDKEALYQATLPCTACWSLKEAEAAEEAVAGLELPELEGTPRQISWARTLRARVISRFRGEANALDRERQAANMEPAAERYMAIVMPALREETKARFWIDNRAPEVPLEAFLYRSQMDELQALRDEHFCPF